ncbi:MAG: YqgE/AlgH family protein [Acidobacteriota bacterium]
MEKPAKGVFLVAGRDLRDPNFARTVVLLVAYGPDGAAGVIVNRPLETTLGDALPELEKADEPSPALYFGGPVEPRRIWMLLRSEDQPDGTESVLEDVYVSSRSSVLEHLLGEEEKNFRVYSGFAGWAPEQLDWEIERGSWWLIEADADSIFTEDPSDLWQRLIRRTSSPLV